VGCLDMEEKNNERKQTNEKKKVNIYIIDGRVQKYRCHAKITEKESKNKNKRKQIDSVGYNKDVALSSCASQLIRRREEEEKENG
jgi:hypothetical protein